jgi:hypothetical protein
MRLASWILALSLASTTYASDLCLAPHPEQGDLDVTCGGVQGANAWIGYSSDDVPCSTVSMETPCGPLGTWTISASDSDPFDNAGWLPSGSTLYLWYLCSGTVEGLAAAAFDLVGTMNVHEFRARDGFLNGGTEASLLLVAANCPTGPVVAGEIHTLGTTTAVAENTWSAVKALYRTN